MEIFKTISLNIFCFFLLLVLLQRTYNRKGQLLLQNRLFIALILSNMIMLVVDSLGWAFNGGQYMFLNTLFNTLLFALMPFPVTIWILYSNYQVFHDQMRMKRVIYPLALLIIINAVISFSSPWTGWFFHVDPYNLYHRGPYFLYHAGLAYAMLFYSFLFIHFNQPLIEKRYFNSLLYFFLPQMICSSLQVLYFGLALNWVGMAFSILVIYITIQDSAMKMDYLTGAYNRRQLDDYLRDNIMNNPRRKKFAAIMIDLDDFKAINDSYGHSIGDEALQNTVAILQNSIQSNDIIIRYGGDEFLVLLKQDNPSDLEATVAKIEKSMEQFNADSNCTYKLSFSMGYALFNPHSDITPAEFLKYIDALLYKNKNEKAMVVVNPHNVAAAD
ncbi:MAG: diguanylate cyclase protein [Firmicutes bacterium]|nr:diguanylate cyclase protein [Bacillota bacterium]